MQVKNQEKEPWHNFLVCQDAQFKDYTRELLNWAKIPLTLSTLALNISASQITFANAVSQIHQTNQDRRSERRIPRRQRAAGTPLASFVVSLSLSADECAAQGSDSTPLRSCTSGNIANPPTPIPGSSVLLEHEGQLRECAGLCMFVFLFVCVGVFVFVCVFCVGTCLQAKKSLDSANSTQTFRKTIKLETTFCMGLIVRSICVYVVCYMYICMGDRLV